MNRRKITEIAGGEPYTYTRLGDYVVEAQGVCVGGEYRHKKHRQCQKMNHPVKT